MREFFEFIGYLPWILVLVGVAFCCLDELWAIVRKER